MRTEQKQGKISPLKIEIPDVLGSSTQDVESLFLLLERLPPKRELELDMSRVHFIYPYGLIGLLAFVQEVGRLTHEQICLSGCQPDVYAYLERINFFKCSSDLVYTTDISSPEHELSRSPASSNLLELQPIENFRDVLMIADRIGLILEQKLNWGLSEQNNLVCILSEMCGNICEHSMSTGHVTVQAYFHRLRGVTRVRIAICDLGIGIPGSLIETYGEFASSASDYIQAALNGRTKRGSNIEGNGFQRVREIMLRTRGTLFVRSHNGAVRLNNSTSAPMIYSNLTFVRGTQIAISLSTDVPLTYQ